MSYIRRFIGFWSDFLVGDRPELFVGPIAALGLTWLAVRSGAPGALSALALFGLIALIGAASIWLVGRE